MLEIIKFKQIEKFYFNMFLKNVDFLSPHITLYFEGKIRHSSVVSGIITILSIISVVGVTVYFLSEIIFKTKVTAYYFPQYLNETMQFKAHEDGIFHFVLINDNFEVDLEKIRIIGVMESFENFFDFEETFDEPEDYPIDHWEYSFCKNYERYRNFESAENVKLYFSNNLNYSLCIDRYFDHKAKKYYKVDEEGFVFPYINHALLMGESIKYGLYIMKNEKCPDEYLITLKSYSIHFLDSYVNINDYQSPFYKFFYNVSNLFDGFEIFTVQYLNLSPLVLRTHQGYVIDSVEKKYFHLYNGFSRQRYLSALTKGNVLGSFYFEMDSSSQIFERSYPKLQETLSNIGGLSKIITVIAFLINRIYNEYIVINDLNRVFDVEKRIFTKRGSIIHLGQNVVKSKTISDITRKIKFTTKSYHEILVREVFLHKLGCKYQKVVSWISSQRARILSEEKIYKMYLLVKCMRRNWGNKGKGKICEGLNYGVKMQNFINGSSSYSFFEVERSGLNLTSGKFVK